MSISEPRSDYSPLTATPDEVGLTATDLPLQAPLPQLDIPTDLPFVGPDPDPEPLVAITAADNGGRIIDLAAYRWAGWPGSRARSVARVEATQRLRRAVDTLPNGFGIAVFDAYRPLELQHLIYDSVYAEGDLEPGFVSIPSPSPLTPPPHLTGGTFDLTLTWRGQALALGTAFDEFTSRAHTRALEETDDYLNRDLRRLLVHAMRSAGFVAYRAEWWHFEYGTRRWAARWMTTPRYGAAQPPEPEPEPGG